MDNNQIVIYQTEDGLTKIEVNFDSETVWLTQAQISELFQRERSVITKHINNVFSERELDEESNVQILHIANSVKPVKLYNLDVIISVGYRVKSIRGTHFRRWATERLKEYMIKGFTMDDERLKQVGGGGYWKELLDRIRDIRSSEKVMYRQVLDLYATSVDYNPKAEESIQFFKIVQNKLHYAAHGHTAAEVIFDRVDADKPFMGLTTFAGEHPTRNDIMVAKNYLNEDELDTLNHLVSAYLDLAELQALRRKPMYMRDWIARLDDYLRMTDSEVLQNAGKVSHALAEQKAKEDYIEKKIQQLDARRERQKQRKAQRADENAQKEMLEQQAEKERLEAFRTAPLKVGEKIRVKENGMVGEVTKVSAKAVTVIIGNISSKMPLDKVERITSNEFKSAVKETVRPVSAVKVDSSINERKLNFSTELDVRGERLNDAIEKVTRYVDDAIMLNISNVRIIHGKGTGVLRDELQKYLRTMPGVASVRDEHIQFGGTGVTIVNFE